MGECEEFEKLTVGSNVIAYLYGILDVIYWLSL